MQISRLQSVGSQGLKMFFISNLLIVMTIGTSLLLSLMRVLWLAVRAGTDARPGHVLVLGKALQDGEIDRDYRQRLDRVLALYKHDTVHRIYLLGGRNQPGWRSESRAGSDYLEKMGIPGQIILLEEESIHTLENLRHARAILRAENVSETALVTNRYHLARSLAMARTLNLSVQPVAAEASRWSGRLFRLLVEAYLLHWYITGRYVALWTKDRASLDQIS